jgi:hypothetical protein
VQLPDVIEPAAHGLTSASQIAPDRDTDPLLQEAVIEPVYPTVESATVVLVPCASAGIEQEQAPLVVDVAAQPGGLLTTIVPDADAQPSALQASTVQVHDPAEKPLAPRFSDQEVSEPIGTVLEPAPLSRMV